MRGGGDTRSGSSVSSGDDFLRIEEIDSKEPHREESDEDECEYNG